MSQFNRLKVIITEYIWSFANERKKGHAYQLTEKSVAIFFLIQLRSISKDDKAKCPSRYMSSLQYIKLKERKNTSHSKGECNKRMEHTYTHTHTKTNYFKSKIQ